MTRTGGARTRLDCLPQRPCAGAGGRKLIRTGTTDQSHSNIPQNVLAGCGVVVERGSAQFTLQDLLGPGSELDIAELTVTSAVDRCSNR